MTSTLDFLTTGPNADRWLRAHDDPLASIYTFSNCVGLSDITGDGDTKLVVADLGSGNYNMKLRVYKGTQMVSEHTIIDLPTGVVTFYMDMTEPKIPAIAVASGAHIYIYKNMKPYFKFTLPSLDIHASEKELWGAAAQAEHGLDLSALLDGLQSLRAEIGDSKLTARTQRLLMINDRNEAQAFVDTHASFSLKKQSVITCISTLRKSHDEEKALSCLVLGTESSMVFILDPEAFTILETLYLPSPPAFFAVNGLFDVDFRIVAACRNGTICTLKRGWSQAKVITLLESQAVGLIRREKTILVGTMDDCLQSFSSKGKRLWSQKLPASIKCVEPVDIPSRSVQLTAVALENRQIILFNDKHVVDCFLVNDIVSAMKFGRFGREDSALVMITISGGLTVKILKRTAQFDKLESALAPTLNKATDKLNIPKKTKLFVEQTQREREQGTAMHRAFQNDLFLLRLNTARAFVSALQTSSNPISTTMDSTSLASTDGNSSQESIKLSAQVMGLGPVFKLIIGLCNTGVTPSRFLLISFYCDDKLYRLSKNMIRIPMLVPGLEYNFETIVECVSDLGISDQLYVFITKDKSYSLMDSDKGSGSSSESFSAKPLLSAIINMPVAEMI